MILIKAGFKHLLPGEHSEFREDHFSIQWMYIQMIVYKKKNEKLFPVVPMCNVYYNVTDRI